jgi:hypothetical protein
MDKGKFGTAIGIALLGVLLTVLFDFVTTGVTEPERLDSLRADSSKFLDFLSVQFDLWIIALTLVVTASFTVANEKQAGLRAAWIAIVVGVILLIALAVLAAVFPNAFVRTVLPDLVGAGVVAYVAYVLGTLR